MKQLGLMIDMDRCIGCKTCIVACRNHHGLVDHASAMPGEIPFYLRVESEREGEFPTLSVNHRVIPCQHCKKAQCIKACPSGAIAKDEQTGIVRIDRDTCTGSRKCLEACPWGVIQFDEAGGFAHKCDLCFDRVHYGQQPVCAEVCMTGAIHFGEVEMLKQQAQAMGREIDRKKSPMSVLYLKPTPRNTLAAG
jgi:polysulfide reductase chain B